jgi:hypothetical protein
MFDQLDEEHSDWVVYEVGAFGRHHPAGDVVALELFAGLPSHYELIGVAPRTWALNRRHTRLTVTGHFRVRPRGSWEVLTLPFSHIRDLAGGRVDKVTSLLDGVELRRLAPAGLRATAARSPRG